MDTKIHSYCKHAIRILIGTSCYRLQGSKMNSTVLLIKGSSCRISIAAVRRGEKMEGKKSKQFAAADM